MITKTVAMMVARDQILYEIGEYNADGTARRWRVNGKCKTWVTRPHEFRLPIKYGLKTCSYITHHNCDFFTFDEPEGRKK